MKDTLPQKPRTSQAANATFEREVFAGQCELLAERARRNLEVDRRSFLSLLIAALPLLRREHRP